MKESYHYLEVSAEVRYWEDAVVNGVEDSHGLLIPCKKGALWEPIIHLASGRIINWAQGVEARIHYKVCDAGLYWLLNAERTRIAQWNSYYVPDRLLCVGDRGYGDYIIMSVDKDGLIQSWKNPGIEWSEWTIVDTNA